MDKEKLGEKVKKKQFGEVAKTIRLYWKLTFSNMFFLLARGVTRTNYLWLAAPL